MTTVYDAAFEYAQAGLSVIPIRADGSKAPPAKWKDYQARFATENELRNWFRDDRHGIGIVCGAISDNLELLDFDAPGLLCDFRDMAYQCGLRDVLASCVLIETPSGGHHVYYRTEHRPEGNKKLAQTVTFVPEGTENAKRVGNRWYLTATLIETRGEGGYAVAPGSPHSCHPSGLPYVVKHGDFKDLPVLDTATREILHGLATTFGNPLPVAAAPVRERTDRVYDGLTPWEDFDQRGDVRMVLERNGWQFVRTRGDVEDWTRPGKSPHDGTSATLYFGGGMPVFYPFTTSTAVFDAQKAYGPARVYAMLEHGGDFSAAAKALRDQGYGSRRSAQ